MYQIISLSLGTQKEMLLSAIWEKSFYTWYNNNKLVSQ